MERYEKLKIEVIQFDSEDVITESDQCTSDYCVVVTPEICFKD